MADGHRVKLVVGDGRIGVDVSLIHPESGCELDQDGQCVLTDWVDEVGEDLFVDEHIFEVPVFVSWPFEEEGPELRFFPDPDKSKGPLDGE